MDKNKAGGSAEERVMAAADICGMIWVDVLFHHEAHGCLQDWFHLVPAVKDQVGNRLALCAVGA